MYRILSLLWLGWALVGHAAAQDFPSRPVMFTVPLLRMVPPMSLPAFSRMA